MTNEAFFHLARATHYIFKDRTFANRLRICIEGRHTSHACQDHHMRSSDELIMPAVSTEKEDAACADHCMHTEEASKMPLLILEGVDQCMDSSSSSMGDDMSKMPALTTLEQENVAAADHCMDVAADQQASGGAGEDTHANELPCSKEIEFIIADGGDKKDEREEATKMEQQRQDADDDASVCCNVDSKEEEKEEIKEEETEEEKDKIKEEGNTKDEVGEAAETGVKDDTVEENKEENKDGTMMVQ